MANLTLKNVQADHTLAVSFKAAPVFFTVSASAGPGGSISPSGAVQVPAGADQLFVITPDAGMVLDVILLDGQPVPPDA